MLIKGALSKRTSIGFGTAGYLGLIAAKRLVFYCKIAQSPKYLATLSGRFREGLSKIPFFAGMKTVKFGRP
ncbi:MAG: hypothetical protein K8R45_15640 [Desulfobacterales bacterium]|nr:hypothetical protein [Desulfobacterales bacterium]